MEDKASAKENTQSKTIVHEIEHVDSELYKVGMYIAAAFTIAVGVWGLVCLSSAVFEGGGPVEMVKSLFQAITGV